MASRWEKLNQLRQGMISSIMKRPSDWIFIQSGDDERPHRILTGNDLILINFDCLFFSTINDGHDMDTTWAIYCGNDCKVATDIIKRYAEKKVLFALRSPLLRNEKRWIAEILLKCQSAVIYARYESDDILIYEND